MPQKLGLWKLIFCGSQSSTLKLLQLVFAPAPSQATLHLPEMAEFCAAFLFTYGTFMFDLYTFVMYTSIGDESLAWIVTPVQAGLILVELGQLLEPVSSAGKAVAAGVCRDSELCQTLPCQQRPEHHHDFCCQKMPFLYQHDGIPSGRFSLHGFTSIWGAYYQWCLPCRNAGTRKA